MISVVIETWNLRDDPRALAALLVALKRDHTPDEVVVTHRGIAAERRAELATLVAGDIVWVELGRAAGYYDHKNAGFAASHGDVVAFIDGDCEPASGWLASLVEPIVDHQARVVAGVTSYRGELAELATRLDFPHFAAERAPHSVRHFFANNVAFKREVFAAHLYPHLPPMFHGQCQVLALELREAGIAIRLAPEARVFHAWPGSLREWLAVRLLRGADTVSLVPYVAAHYAGRAAPWLSRVPRLPALAVLGTRAVAGTWWALRRRPVARGLALVAGVSLFDAIGAIAAPQVYRALASST